MKASRTRLLIAAIMLTALAAADAQAPSSAQPAAAQGQQLLKAEQLDQLVAPVALYPDALLAEILMASTYPLEIVQADRWASENNNLKGDQLKAAVEKQAWDDSVKSLVAAPSVLSMMSTKLDWTQKLGDTVLAQQADVMDAVQRLRTKAQANNKLTSTKEQKVTVKQEQNRQIIVIEPAVPNTIYVPYYNPAVIYGAWPYPAYPPYYFAPPPGYVAGAAIASGIAFGAGYALGRWASGGNYWGGGMNWGSNNINVNRSVNINNGNINTGNINSGNWQHNPAHRGGVRYSNTNVQQRFANNNISAGSRDRVDFRGRSGDQVLKSGSGGAGFSGQRPGNGQGVGGQRPGGSQGMVGQRPANGANLADRRPGGGGQGLSDRRPAGLPGGGGRDSAFGNMSSGRVANMQGDRGRASLGGGGGGGGAGRFGGAGAGGGGGGIRSGGGGGGGGGPRGGGGAGRRR